MEWQIYNVWHGDSLAFVGQFCVKVCLQSLVFRYTLVSRNMTSSVDQFVVNSIDV